MTAHTVRRHQPGDRPWGSPVEIPDPVGITLDTSELKEYAD